VVEKSISYLHCIYWQGKSVGDVGAQNYRNNRDGLGDGDGLFLGDCGVHRYTEKDNIT